MSKEGTYAKSFEELQDIVQDIENGEISVDILSEKVKRAAELIKVCRKKLTETEEDVARILKDLSGADDPNAEVEM
ncbi:MAG: exodeoxyribonuclease VII small subunit [Crocinitomicaceae bacterium]|nr:exodeoxyribonuclease VII small subunit [Crocinitomicaceae bacterium]MBK8925199.1 exodeoxyribonuclease VII small subunit [Crocinitomicaceae bacterium]